MMGASVSTTLYFPLVDGAHYDCTDTGSPWATSTAVMHAGQTWAGISGLMAMHTTYTCVSGVSCAPDYAAGGDPLWYLVVGNLANAGGDVVSTGTLDKYRGGQCASCTYQMPPMMGSDGTMTITFTSPTEATLQLPSGRRTQIQPLAW